MSFLILGLNIGKSMAHSPLPYVVLQNKLALLGLTIVLTMAIGSLFAPFLAPYDPVKMVIKERTLPPSSGHWFGTDEYGRDIFSRILYGGQIAFLVSFLSVFCSTIVGVPLGLLAAYYLGFVDRVIGKILDGMFAFPPILMALAIMATLGSSMSNLILAIVIVFIPNFARITRSTALSISQQEFTTAAQASGAPDWYIIFCHILPNCLSPVIVQVTVSLAYAILIEASLSFLGLGVPPPHPTWGGMLLTGRDFMLDAPWMAIFPGAAIALLVLGFNLLGDGLRDILDPQQKK